MKPLTVRGVPIGTGMPKICVPIVGRDPKEIKSQAERIAESPADMAEWRCDYFETFEYRKGIGEILPVLRDILGDKPLIFTFRSSREGGRGVFDFDDYADLLIFAASCGAADFVDVEAFSCGDTRELISAVKGRGAKVIGSYHDFHRTPDRDEIVGRLGHMIEMGADISKIAVTPNDRRDVCTLLEATDIASSRYDDCPLVTVSMTRLGAISRVSGEIFGSAITFGSLGELSAPGQMDVAMLRKMLEALGPDGQIGY